MPASTTRHAPGNNYHRRLDRRHDRRHDRRMACRPARPCGRAALAPPAKRLLGQRLHPLPADRLTPPDLVAGTFLTLIFFDTRTKVSSWQSRIRISNRFLELSNAFSNNQLDRCRHSSDATQAHERQKRRKPEHSGYSKKYLREIGVIVAPELLQEAFDLTTDTVVKQRIRVPLAFAELAENRHGVVRNMCTVRIVENLFELSRYFGGTHDVGQTSVVFECLHGLEINWNMRDVLGLKIQPSIDS